MNEEHVWQMYEVEHPEGIPDKANRTMVRFTWPSGAVEEFTHLGLGATIGVLQMQGKRTTEYKEALAAFVALKAMP
jgi:hypothetical protein